MRFMLAVLIAVAGCGGGGSNSLNPAMAGTWPGTTTVTLQGASPFIYSSLLTVSVSGSQGTVSGICYDGSGSMSASGSGDTLLWSGSSTCPPVKFFGCLAVTVTFQSANIHVSSHPYDAGHTLTAQGSADVSTTGPPGSGCGSSEAATFSFTGNR
jgi:hypothetical protein